MSVYTQVQQALNRAKLGKIPTPYTPPKPSGLERLQLPVKSSGWTVGAGTPKPPKAGKGAILSALGALDWGRSAIASTLKEGIDFIQGEDFDTSDWWDQTKSHYGFGDLIREERTAVGWGLMALAPFTGGITAGALGGLVLADNIHLDRAIGFIGDVAIDPLTYMGGYNVIARNMGGYKKMGSELYDLSKLDPQDLVRLGNEAGVKNLGKGSANKMKKAIDDAVRAGRDGRSMSSISRSLNKTEAGQGVARMMGLDAGMRLRVPFTGPVARAGRNLDKMVFEGLKGAGATMRGATRTAIGDSSLRGVGKYLDAAGAGLTGAAKMARRVFPDDTGLHRLLDGQRVRNVPVAYKRGYTDAQYKNFVKDMRIGRASQVPEDIRKTVGTVTRAPREVKLPTGVKGGAVFRQADFIQRGLRNLPLFGSVKPWRLWQKLSQSETEDARQVFNRDYWKTLTPEVRDELQGGLVKMFRNRFSVSDEVWRQAMLSNDPETIAGAWAAESTQRFAKGQSAFVRDIVKKGRNAIFKRSSVVGAQITASDAYKLAEAVTKLEMLILNVNDAGKIVEPLSATGINRNTDWFKNLPHEVRELPDEVLVQYANDVLRMMKGVEDVASDEIPEFKALMEELLAREGQGFIPRRMTQPMRKRFGFSSKIYEDDFDISGMLRSQSSKRRGWGPGQPVTLQGQAVADARSAGRITTHNGELVINQAKGSNKPFIVEAPRDAGVSVRQQINDLSMDVFGEAMYEDNLFKVLDNWGSGMGMDVTNNAWLSELKRQGWPIESFPESMQNALKRESEKMVAEAAAAETYDLAKGVKHLTRLQTAAMAYRATSEEDLKEVSRVLEDYRRRLKFPEKFRDDMPIGVTEPRAGADSSIVDLEMLTPPRSNMVGTGAFFKNAERTGALDQLFARVAESDPDFAERLLLYLNAGDATDDVSNLVEHYVASGQFWASQNQQSSRAFLGGTPEFIDEAVQKLPQLFSKGPDGSLVYQMDQDWARQVLLDEVDRGIQEMDQYQRLVLSQVSVAGELQNIADELDDIGRELAGIGNALQPNGRVPDRVDELLLRQYELGARYQELHDDFNNVIAPQVKTFEPRITALAEGLVTRQIPEQIGYSPSEPVVFKGLSKLENENVNGVLDRIFNNRDEGDTILLRRLLGIGEDAVEGFHAGAIEAKGLREITLDVQEAYLQLRGMALEGDLTTIPEISKIRGYDPSYFGGKQNYTGPMPSAKEIRAVQKELQKRSQEALADFPETITVYRFGEPQTNPSFTLNPTYDPVAAGITGMTSARMAGTSGAKMEAFTVKKKDILFAMDTRGGPINIFDVPEAEVLIRPSVSMRVARKPITIVNDLQAGNKELGNLIEDSAINTVEKLKIVNESAKQIKLTDRSIAVMRDVENIIDGRIARGAVGRQPRTTKHFSTWEEYMNAAKGDDVFGHNNFIDIPINGTINMDEARGLLDDVLNRTARLEQSILLNRTLDPIERAGRKPSVRYKQFDMTDEEIVAATQDLTGKSKRLFTEAQRLRQEAEALRTRFAGSESPQSAGDIEALEKMALVAEMEAQSVAREAADFMNLSGMQRGVASLQEAGVDLPSIPTRKQAFERDIQGYDPSYQLGGFDPIANPRAMNEQDISTWMDSVLDGMSNWGPWRIATGNTELNEGMVAAAEAFKRMNTPKEVEGLLRTYDKFQNFLKAGMIATPGFVFRNIFGAFFNAWLDGVNPTHMIKAANITKRVGEKASKDNLSFVEAARALAKASDDEYLQNYVSLLEAGVRGGGQATVSVKIPTAGGVQRVLPDQYSINAAVGRSSGAGTLQLANTPVGLGNHVRGQIVFGMPDAAASDLVATSAYPWASNFAYYQMIRSANMQVEDIIRLGVGLDTMRWGGSVDDGLERIAKSQFDYSELTEFERNVMQRFMPFYTWTRKNVPYQLQQLGKHPNKYNAVMNAKRNLEWGTEEEGYVPDYLLQPFGIRMPFTASGARVYSVPDLPFQDLLRYDPTATLTGELGDPLYGVKETLQNFAWQLSPILKTPVEMAFQQRLAGAPFTGEKVIAPQPLRSIPGLMQALETVGWATKDKKEGWQIADHNLYLVTNALPAFSHFRRLIPSEEKYQERFFETMFSSMAGLSVKRNTPEMQKSYKKYLRYLQSKLDAERGVTSIRMSRTPRTSVR
jgi:hypothetical protein